MSPFCLKRGRTLAANLSLCVKHQMSLFNRLQLRGGGLRRAFTVLGSIGAASGTIGTCAYMLATRHQKFHELDAASDPLALSSIYQTSNPHSNKTMSDVYEARVPLAHIRPELVNDFQRGGSKLVEAYCSGVLGGWCMYLSSIGMTAEKIILTLRRSGFAVQRELSFRHAKRSGPIGPGEAYTKEDILNCKFDPGRSTYI
jgi:hypothetical protein